jgi:hypothetical protein
MKQSFKVNEVARALAVLLLAPAVAGSPIHCLDGNNCPSNHTCANLRQPPREQQKVGLLNGCAPGLQSVICSDSRFSCPATFICDLTAMRCVGGEEERQLVDTIASSSRNDTLTSSLGDSFCQIIKGDLPSGGVQALLTILYSPYYTAGCTCTDKPLGCDAECTIDMLGIDKIGITMDIEPCASPAFVNLVFTEKVGVQFPHCPRTHSSTLIVHVHSSALSYPGRRR